MLAPTLLATLALAMSVLGLSTIERKGAKFFKDGEQFFVKGVAYQLTPDDPLSQPEQCKLDAALMKKLGANSIRVYHVEPQLSHDDCMQAFADAGIYAWIDLDTFSTYLLADGPTWTKRQAQAFQRVMDAFHSYDNVAGFFVANELLTTGESSVAAPYVKAAARDMKMYRDRKGYREIPIGYSAADIAELRPNLQNYMACGDDIADSLDFYSLNAYEWCGESTFETSGYVALQENATDYNIPIFFSETGCNTVKPRTFGDQAAIFGEDMAGTWSGSIIYEWIQELNDYGLITYGPPAGDPSLQDPDNAVAEGFTRTGTPTPVSPDFENLRSQWATLSPTGVKQDAYKPSNSAPDCPAFTSGFWEVSKGADLPTLGRVEGGGPTGSGAMSGSGSLATPSVTSGAGQATQSSGRNGNGGGNGGDNGGDGNGGPDAKSREQVGSDSGASTGADAAEPSQGAAPHTGLRRRQSGEQYWTQEHKWIVFVVGVVGSIAIFPVVL